MNQSKIIILSILLIALCALGGLYLKNQQDIAQLSDQLKQQELEVKFERQEMELARLRKESGLVNTGASGTSEPASHRGNTGKSARELQLEEELERLKKQNLGQQEENALINRKAVEINDENLKSINRIVEAQVVGKVDSYDRDQNILIFHAIGQPNLKNGQELAVRRRGLVFVFITVEELDPSSGAYIASVKRDEIFDADTGNTLQAGEDIIIPPASIKDDLPDLNKNALKTDLPPIPMDPVTTSK